MTYADIALRHIEDAELSATEYRAARRLLDLAQRSAGVVRLEPDDAAQLCGVTSWAAARRILAAIDAAGVVTCHTYGAAQVAFAAWFDASTRAISARVDNATASDPRRNGAAVMEYAQALDLNPRQNGADRTETARVDELAESNPRRNGADRAESARVDGPDESNPRRNGADRAESARVDEPDESNPRRNGADRAESARVNEPDESNPRRNGADRAESARVDELAESNPRRNGADRAESARVDRLSPHTHARARPSLGLTTGRQAGKDTDLPACLPERGMGETAVAGMDDQSAGAATDAAAISAADAARSIDLLTDPEIGWDLAGASVIASKHPFEEVRAHVFRARRDMAAGKISSFGAIKLRLARGYGASVVDADRASSLWRRHTTLEDEDAERRRKYFPAEYEDIIVG